MIGNLPPDTTDDDLRAFVHKYMHEVEIGHMTHLDGDDPHLGMLLEIPGAEQKLLAELQRRLHHMVWKGCALSVHVMLFAE
ncbi:hypothetical protein [Burkholderia sp. PU8-34]